MAISFSRYVDITSGVGAASVVTRRELIGRLFTNSELLPTNTLLEFTTPAAVSDYFGANSPEALRALFYFGFISKNGTSANRISFARWTNVDVAPLIIGGAISTTLATFTAITDGAFDITIGGVETVLSGLDFSSATSFADVATIIQTAIRGGTGTVFTNSTVTYDAANTRFRFAGGETGVNTISVAAPSAGTNLVDLIGWGSTARFSAGAVTQTVTEALTASTSTSNNFGSFGFIATLADDQIEEAATWVNGQNVRYIYCARVTASNASDIFNAISGDSGVAMTLADATVTDEYPELAPMLVLAATDYDARGSVQNYMYQQFSLTPTVLTDADADIYDAIRVNYYGRTQTAGTTLDFYQRGVMTGTATAPLDINTFANEIWLRSAAERAVGDLLIASSAISANDSGRAAILGVLRPVATLGVTNGTISIDNTFTAQEILFITQITGDDTAHRQVATSGFWINVTFRNDANNTAVYNLVYAKDDVVRRIEGTHTLI